LISEEVKEKHPKKPTEGPSYY
jgi:hypothetical protein